MVCLDNNRLVRDDTMLTQQGSNINTGVSMGMVDIIVGGIYIPSVCWIGVDSVDVVDLYVGDMGLDDVYVGALRVSECVWWTLT